MTIWKVMYINYNNTNNNKKKIINSFKDYHYIKRVVIEFERIKAKWMLENIIIAR